MNDDEADRDLDALLDMANPVTEEDIEQFDLAPQYADLLTRITHDEQSDAVVSRKLRRGRRSIAAVGVAVAVAATGGVAAAAWTSAHTGWFGQPGTTEGDSTEYLNAAGDDFAQAVHQLAVGIQFPAGDSVDEYIPVVFPREGLVQAGGVRLILSIDASCAWQGYWLQANAAGDTEQQNAAALVLAEVPTWSAIVSHDGGGTIASYRQVADAAAAGAPGLVQQWWSANCSGLPRAWATK